MPEIICDENNRVLTVDGEYHPHITQVLADLGLSRDYNGVDPWYAARGHAVHWGCKLINEGKLDEESFTEEIKGYLSAYRAWLAESGFTPQYSELALFSPIHRFVGTLDIVGLLPTVGRVIIDLKTSSSLDPAVEIQTGAQEILWLENFPQHDIAGRYALQLKSDGTYRLKDVSHVTKSLFVQALELWRWQQTHKRKPKGEKNV